MSTVQHDTITVGDTVPALERTITLVDMVAYAGATWDWYRSHYDPAFVEAAKLPAPMVDGQVFGALLVEQLQDWLGPLCFVSELSFTFKNLVFAGETVRCEGTVTEVEEGLLRADLQVVVVAEDGTAGRVAAGAGRAVVLLGVADGPGAGR
ncbi:MaoC/PaaZ C-terminal domain-containing protein [Nocardioides sp.]|uniref:MaoC family dehydratase n=1 Tax=Nocardioides sp. TaxID=35761 RepID=UPI00261D6602|nr:MaoC/PaaZ C-terminal domain-containing protein [Nocardioides sp.]